MFSRVFVVMLLMAFVISCDKDTVSTPPKYSSTQIAKNDKQIKFYKEDNTVKVREERSAIDVEPTFWRMCDDSDKMRLLDDFAIYFDRLNGEKKAYAFVDGRLAGEFTNGQFNLHK